MPAHRFHGSIRSFEPAGVLPHHGFPQGLRAGRVKDPEARLDRDQVARSFVWPATFLILRRSHPEDPGRYPPEALDDVPHPQGTRGTIQPILAPFRGPDRGDAVMERVRPELWP